MQSRYLVCMEVFQEFPITLFEINDTKMWLSGTKRKIKTDFGKKEISVKNTFRAIFALFSICFFAFWAVFWSLLKILRNQAQPNNFSLGWKNIFFLRRMWRKHLPDGVPTGRNRCGEVRKSPSFSLFGGRKLSKSGWHNERWILFGAYVLLAGLRVVCLILVQEVSKSCGGGDTKGFCKCVRIVSFLRVCLHVRNMRFWGGGSDNLAKWYLDKKT